MDWLAAIAAIAGTGDSPARPVERQTACRGVAQCATYYSAKPFVLIAWQAGQPVRLYEVDGSLWCMYI